MEELLFQLAIAAVMYVLSVLVFLHMVRKDINALSSPISEYVLGKHGRWMTSALWVWSIASFVFAAGIFTAVEHSASALWGSGLLVVFGLGLAITACFPMDLPFPPQRFHPSEFSSAGLRHIIAATASTTCFPVAAIMISLGLAADATWQHFRPTALGLAIVCACATAAFFVVSGLSLRYFGITQRVVVGADLLWQAVVAVVFLAT